LGSLSAWLDMTNRLKRDLITGESGLSSEICSWWANQKIPRCLIRIATIRQAFQWTVPLSVKLTASLLISLRRLSVLCDHAWLHFPVNSSVTLPLQNFICISLQSDSCYISFPYPPNYSRGKRANWFRSQQFWLVFWRWWVRLSTTSTEVCHGFFQIFEHCLIIGHDSFLLRPFHFTIC
jgi:hypothetical protein